MTCRHGPGDTNCSSHPYNVAQRERERIEEERAKTPDASNYEVVDFHREGPHVVMKVRYPNCASCAFEGTKVMVFLNVTEAQIALWRTIDPHFREPGQGKRFEAPSPAARFPGSEEGWDDALQYARSKARR